MGIGTKQIAETMGMCKVLFLAIGIGVFHHLSHDQDGHKLSYHDNLGLANLSIDVDTNPYHQGMPDLAHAQAPTASAKASHPSLTQGATNAATCASAALPVPANALANPPAPTTPLGGIALLATTSAISAG